MIIENDPIQDLLVQLANSLIERYQDSQITMTEKEYEIVKNWVIKIGNAVESQAPQSGSCIQ